MSFLVVGGITVPIAASSTPSRSDEEIGDRARSFDGTMRQTVIAVKHNHAGETVPISKTDADALVTALQASPPITCSGDWLGASGSYFGQVTDYHAVKVGSPYYIVAFTLMEA